MIRVRNGQWIVDVLQQELDGRWSVDVLQQWQDARWMVSLSASIVVGWLVLADSGSVQLKPKDIRGAEELTCEKVKVIQIADEQNGTIEVRSPPEVPLDTKAVTIRKGSVTVQPLDDRAKPAEDFQTFRIVSTSTFAIRGVKEDKTSITALAINLVTGRMVLSSAMTDDSVSPGTKGFIAYFQCTRHRKLK